MMTTVNELSVTMSTLQFKVVLFLFHYSFHAGNIGVVKIYYIILILFL